MKVKRNAKAVIGAVGTFVTALSAATADNVIGLDEVPHLISTLVLGGITVWSIWKVPNKQPVKLTKDAK